MNFNLISLFVVALFGVSQIKADFEPGTCLQSPVISNFDPSKYLGLWYEIQKYNYIFEDNLNCVRATYGAFNASTVTVHNTGVNKNSQKLSVVDGFATVPDLSKPNQLVVNLPIKFENVTFAYSNAPYNVWLTDYTTYSCVYSCTQIIPGALKLEIFWILSRTKTLDQKIVDSVKQFLQSKNIDITRFKVNDQSCP